jgi:hypothetical protein
MTLEQHRQLIGPSSLAQKFETPRKSHGQLVADWLRTEGVDFQLFITRTPSVYQTTLQKQRELTANAIRMIQESIGSQHRLAWLAGFETFPGLTNQCHSHILVASDTVEFDPYYIKKLLSFDSHTDVKRVDPQRSAYLGPVGYTLKQCTNPNCDWDFSDNLLEMRKKTIGLADFKKAFHISQQTPVLRSS